MAGSQRIGQQLGNYRLTRLLGTGGFAEVYSGEHIHLHIEAAIKVLHTRIEQEDAMAFAEEARTIARLKHPHIVRVLDFGIEGTLPYLVMDYAPHGSLRTRHERGAQLPLGLVLTYVRQLGDALQFAHDQKLIHRDLKPENILVNEHGDLVLSDFGIATMAQSSRSQNTQDIVGTAAYMSPEQLQGKPRPASDQYSLGIMVYEWLTGVRPFVGTFTEIASQHLLTPPPPLREKRPDLPLAVEQVLMTALAKDPHQRFGNIKAFQTAFEQACEQRGQGVHEHNVRTYISPMPPVASQKPAPEREVVQPPARFQGNQMGATIAPRSRSETLSADTPPAPYPYPVAPTVTSQPAFVPRQQTEPVLPGKRRGFGWVYVLLVVTIVAGIALFVWKPWVAAPFNQQIAVGTDIRDLAVGTGYDTSSGQLADKNSTFTVGSTIYMAAQLVQGTLANQNVTITDNLSYPDQGFIPVGQGQFDGSHDIYYNEILATISGTYTWKVSYNSSLEASITFQII